MKLDKTKKIQLSLLIAALLGLGYQLFIGSDSNNASSVSVSTAETNTSAQINSSNDSNNEPMASAANNSHYTRPRSTNVHDTVETLAQSYVDGSINQDEATAYLVKVSSLRIARQNRAIQEERLATARFRRQVAQEELELAKLTSEHDSLDKPPREVSPIQIIHSERQPERESSTDVDLSSYRVLSISRRGGESKVRMSYRGSTFQAIEGQEVVGGAYIDSISASSVTIQSGSDKRIIHGL